MAIAQGKEENKLDLVPSSPQNKVMLVKICCIAAILTFFFLTPMIFSNLNEYLITPIGQRTELASYKYVTINSWTYSQKQHRMEVELGFENLQFDGNNSYSFEAYSRSLSMQKLSTETLLSSPDLYVVVINDLPSNWNEVVLRISAAGNSGQARLYSNKVVVDQVSEITEKTEPEYRISSLERRIANIENEIDAYNEQISECRLRIENIQNDIAELEERKQYQTATEIGETNRVILNYNTLITNEQSTIKSLESEITECQSRIEMAQRQIADIQAGTE